MYQKLNVHVAYVNELDSDEVIAEMFYGNDEPRTIPHNDDFVVFEGKGSWRVIRVNHKITRDNHIITVILR